jgi:hypothetical protein
VNGQSFGTGGTRPRNAPSCCARGASRNRRGPCGWDGAGRTILPIRPDSRVDWPVKRRCPCGKVFFAFSSLRLWCSKSCESWHGHPPKTPLVPLKVTPSGTVGASVSPCNALRGTNPAGYPPLCLKRSGARSAGLAKCPQVACQKKPARRQEDDAGPMCPRLSRGRLGPTPCVACRVAGWRAPGSSDRSARLALLPPPSVENACRSTLLRAVQ